jgi:hypothetical protein
MYVYVYSYFGATIPNVCCPHGHDPAQPMATSAQDAIGYERTQAFQLVMAVVKALLVILFSVHVALALGWPRDAENFGVSTSENGREFFPEMCLVGVVSMVFWSQSCCVYFSIQILERSIGVWMPP